jgi:polar amino acid transport system substrate-binding protein/glutamate/aspartate transport system substrate-binding protein
MSRILLAALAAAFALASTAYAGALDGVRKDGAVRIGYRTDAMPMSYKNDIGEPAGYVVDLCREVVAGLKTSLGLAQIEVKYVPVTAEDRFEAVSGGKVDLLCEATTMTLSRREKVDFSLPVFIDGASVLARADGPETFDMLAGQKVGVRGGTTTENALRATLAKTGVSADVVPVPDHLKAIDLLKSGEIAAYFADRVILMYLAARSDTQLKLSGRYLSYETYALALPKDDGEFRLAVDKALSRIYRSGVINNIFSATFGPGAKPSDALSALYLINALPD